MHCLQWAAGHQLLLLLVLRCCRASSLGPDGTLEAEGGGGKRRACEALECFLASDASAVVEHTKK